MSQKITNAVIAVAGLGTRMLPASKITPKEMLLLVDKPVVQYLVEECIESGIENILFITSKGKSSLQEHFTAHEFLEHLLKKKKKTDLLDIIKHTHKQAQFFYVYQNELLGVGHAILQGEQFLKDQPFAMFYADDIITGTKTPAIKQLMKVYKTYESPVLGAFSVPKKEIPKYGIIDGKKVNDKVYSVTSIVEKPEIKDATTNLASIGRFILTPDIFDAIRKTKLKNGEIYLAEALDVLAKKRDIYAYAMDGEWNDCGSKIGLWQANVRLGLQHPEIKKQAKKFLSQL